MGGVWLRHEHEEAPQTKAERRDFCAMDTRQAAAVESFLEITRTSDVDRAVEVLQVRTGAQSGREKAKEADADVWERRHGTDEQACEWDLHRAVAAHVGRAGEERADRTDGGCVDDGECIERNDPRRTFRVLPTRRSCPVSACGKLTRWRRAPFRTRHPRFRWG